MAEFIFSAFADEAGTTLEEQIKALKENGIRYIEPRQINKKGVLDLSEEELVEIEKQLTAAGIKVNSLGSPIGKFNITDDFEIHYAAFKKALKACHILKTDKIRMFSFFVDQDKLEMYRDEVIRRMRIMTEEAAKEGITLCHENESLIYGQMPKEVADLLDNVPGLAGIFDPANYRMNNGDVIEGINATLKNFAYMHIKDAVYETQTILPAGEGEGKIGEIIDIINENHEGLVYLTLEPHLHIFDAYKDIDEHELKGKYSFKNNREAFDFAVKSLETLLTKYNYKKDEFGVWKK